MSVTLLLPFSTLTIIYSSRNELNNVGRDVKLNPTTTLSIVFFVSQRLVVPAAQWLLPRSREPAEDGDVHLWYLRVTKTRISNISSTMVYVSKFHLRNEFYCSVEKGYQ